MTEIELIKKEIERRIEQYRRLLAQDLLKIERRETNCCLQQCKELLQFIDSLHEEPASEDLEESARHYLLHKHISPLNDLLHQCDLKTEMQYHKDIEDAYKAGAGWSKTHK